MKGFLIILACLLAILFAGFHPQVMRAVDAGSAWVKELAEEDACLKDDQDSRKACADEHNAVAGKIDPRFDMSDQQRALNKALGN